MPRTEFRYLRSGLQSKILNSRITNPDASNCLAAGNASDLEIKPACTEKSPESEHSQSRLIRGQSIPDSGYGSYSEGKTGVRVDGPIIAFPEKPIPPELQNRFNDIKLLFALPLLDLISAIRTPTKDVSIKLRWMGSDEASARPYIIIQCDRRAVKNVKRYFTQRHAREQVGTDFLVDVIPGLRRLASQNFNVSGGVPAGRTLCGMSIRIGTTTTKLSTMTSKATMATLGGVVAVEKPGSETTFFGFTAGHSLALLGAHSDVDIPQLDVRDRASDIGSDYDTSDDDEQCFQSLSESLSRPMAEIGSIKFHSYQKTHPPRNFDWALVTLGREKLLPNLLMGDHGGEIRALECEDVPVRISDTTAFFMAQTAGGVSVITQRGLQKGKLAQITSVFLMSPGKCFVDTYDFIPGAEFGLQPGYSGSWRSAKKRETCSAMLYQSTPWVRAI